jgi:hypothetical protein
MFETLEEKIIAGALGVLVVLGLAAYFAFHFVDLGKAEADARVAVAEQKAAASAQETESIWQGKLDAANQTHMAEMAELRGTIFVLSNPPTPSVRKPPAGRPSVPPSASVPETGSASSQGGGLCSDVLQTPPVELRAEFDTARRADALAADYRALYNSWPSAPPPR